MNQSKFSLADVLTLLTAIAFGFVCFLSFNFITLGNTRPSVMIALIIALLMCCFALGAKWFKQTGRNFKSSFIIELILFLLFLITAFLSTDTFTHYFSVSSQKKEIKQELNNTISQAENMYLEYEKYAENRQAAYRSQLHKAVISKYIDPQQYDSFGFQQNTIPDEKQIASKLEAAQLKLFPSNFDEMKDKSGKWLSESKKVINGWNPIRIVDIVNNVEQNSKEWLDQLVKISQEREPGESANDFTYDFTYDNAKTYFTNYARPTLLSVTLSLVAYALMLLSWLVTKRHTKFPGFYVLFSKGKNTVNEL